jgi:hypothetical protein
MSGIGRHASKIHLTTFVLLTALCGPDPAAVWRRRVNLCQRLGTDCWGLVMWRLFLVAALTLAAASCAAPPSRADLEALAIR